MNTPDEVAGEVFHFLQENPKYADLLRRIVAFEESHGFDKEPGACVKEGCKFKTFSLEEAEEHDKGDGHYVSWYGISWEWGDVRAVPAYLNKLLISGVIAKVFDSRSSKRYRLADREAAAKALRAAEAGVDSGVHSRKKPASPIHLFDEIIGYDDVKGVLRDIVSSGEQGHALLWGPPATAKTYFLLDLQESVPGAELLLGSSTTHAGLTQFLLQRRPTMLLIDEIEKMPREELAVLLSLMETGIVREVKYGRDASIHRLETKVVAAGNNIRKLPRELVSRFEPWVFHFDEYSDEDLKTVAVGVLTRRSAEPGLARYIVEKALSAGIRDVRGFIGLAKLAKNKADVDRYVEIIRRRRRRGDGTEGSS